MTAALVQSNCVETSQFLAGCSSGSESDYFFSKTVTTTVCRVNYSIFSLSFIVNSNPSVL